MQELGPAQAAPTQEELISLCESKVKTVMDTESSEEGDADRVWILRKNFQNFLYGQGLQNYAPQLITSILQYTSISGPNPDGLDDSWDDTYDFTQKHYTGFRRKFEAIIGNRAPNFIAVPNNPADEEGVRATKAANPAAIYVRDKCDLEGKHLEQSGKLFDFGTTFWHIDWVIDGDKYGYREEPVLAPQPTPAGNAGFQCPQCGASTPSDDPQPQSAPESCSQCSGPLSMDNFQPPTSVDMPAPAGPPKRVAKGGLEVNVYDSNEVWVPLDCESVDDEDCDWLRFERERPKSKLLQKYPQLRESTGEQNEFDSNASQIGTLIRSAMSSPLGLVRANRSSRWTCVDEWWKPSRYELIDDKPVRDSLKQNFPDGARFIYVKGKLLEIRAEKLADHWQECKPEPNKSIITPALGDEWTETTDILNNTANQQEQHLARCNLPILVNSNKFDTDAWQNRQSSPLQVFGILPRAGRALKDEIATPDVPQFSEQLPAFRVQIADDTKNNTCLPDAIWGGGVPDPTARQTLLKTNQALMGLGLFWTQIRKCLEKVMLKSCRVLGDYAEGIIAFSKKNQFGRFNMLSFTAEDLKSDTYHFEADEAIPVNWGQQRDQLMWILSQAAENPQLLHLLGADDPFNVFEYKQTLGIPGMRTPQFDAREKGMDVIAKLIDDVKNGNGPQDGPPDPTTGQPGPKTPTVQPDWEDDHAFMALLAKNYLLENSTLKADDPDAYENIQLYGQAQDAMANQPPPPPPPKDTVSFAVKSSDVGPQATQDILTKQGLLDQGTPVAAVPPPLDPNKAMQQPLPNGAPAPAGPPIQ